jgi:hypothetical protein
MELMETLFTIARSKTDIVMNVMNRNRNTRLDPRQLRKKFLREKRQHPLLHIPKRGLLLPPRHLLLLSLALLRAGVDDQNRNINSNTRWQVRYPQTLRQDQFELIFPKVIQWLFQALSLVRMDRLSLALVRVLSFLCLLLPSLNSPLISC